MSDGEPNEYLAVVSAPFTDEQVKSLNGCQQITLVYPITCTSEVHDRAVNLVATNAGWVCPDESCDYTQDWAHQFRVDGSWRPMKERWDALFVRRRGRGADSGA